MLLQGGAGRGVLVGGCWWGGAGGGRCCWGVLLQGGITSEGCYCRGIATMEGPGAEGLLQQGFAAAGKCCCRRVLLQRVLLCS